MVTPINRGRLQEGGRLAVHKNDFNAHVSGGGFRQKAHTVDIDAIEGVVGSTVQEVLESLNTLITSAGSGFISIGLADGYAQGSYTVGAEGYDNLRDAFNAAVTDSRLQNGGVILMLAGTYTTSATITVPSGITVLGEDGGTIIVGEMADAPMFQISNTNNRLTIGGNDGSGDLTLDSAAKIEGVKFVNLTLTDNMDGYAAFGSPSMTSVPMIRMEANTTLTCEFVRFIGRLSAGSEFRDSTYAAVGVDSPSSSGTHLSLYKCFMDGIATGVYFTPSGGDSDTLKIDNCRARIFGGDDNAADGGIENTFAVITACNAFITNNFVHVGPNTFIDNLVYVTEAYDDNSTIIITGTSGASAADNTNYGALFWAGTETLNVVQHNNNWGNRLGEWYVVAGLDYVGPSALDRIVDGGISSGLICYVTNNYTVTNSGSNGLRLVGVGYNIPTITLNVTSGNDTFISTNRLYNIKSAENIKFVSTSNYHTVRLSANSSQTMTTRLNNCIFENCTAQVNETLSSTEFTNLSVTNCSFSQTGTFSENLSLLLPVAKNTLVENCTFQVAGYVGGIGDSSSYSSAMTNGTVLVKNCTMIYTGTQINTLSPLVGTRDHFFWIAKSDAKVTIEDCKILANADLDADDVIDTTILGDDFTKFIYVMAKNITVSNCTVNGSDTTYDFSSVAYIMPSLYLEPQSNATVIDSKFIGGGFPLQIGGITAFTGLSGTAGTTADRLKNGGITIRNCDFVAESVYGFTCLDIDVDLTTVPTYIKPKVVIDGCHFTNANSDAIIPVRHFAMTGSNYEAQGMVQIYAALFDVHFTNNIVKGGMWATDITGNTFDYFGGLVLNNIHNDTLSNQIVSSTFISNNTIYFQTALAEEILMDDIGAFSVFLKTSYLNMNNNFVTMYFDGAETDDSHLECLRMYIDDTVGYGDSIVSGNTFSYRNDEGTAGMLNDYYVQVGSGSASGSFVNNSFSDLEFNTSSGTSSTTQINDPTNTWYIFGNRNHQKVLTATSGMGQYSVRATVDPTNSELLLKGGTPVDSIIEGSITGGSSVIFNFNDTGDVGSVIFKWVIPGSELPYGVTVTRAKLNYQLAAYASITTKDLAVSIISSAGTDGTSSAISTASATSRTTNASVDHINVPENSVRVLVQFNIDDAADTAELEISSLEITYNW